MHVYLQERISLDTSSMENVQNKSEKLNGKGKRKGKGYLKSTDHREGMCLSVQAAYKSFSKDKSHIHSTYCKTKRSIFFQIYDELL